MSGESQGQTLGEDDRREAELAGQGMPDYVSGIKGDHSTSFYPEFLFCLLKMEKFRSLLFTSEDDERIHMVNNFRPPQPLMGRLVKASFRV